MKTSEGRRRVAAGLTDDGVRLGKAGRWIAADMIARDMLVQRGTAEVIFMITLKPVGYMRAGVSSATA